MSESAFLNSAGLSFSGTSNTIAFNNCLFSFLGSGKTILSVNPSAVINRRFRIIYSSFVVGSGSTGISMPQGVSIPPESYILDTVNFSGAGTYLSGISSGNDTNNKDLFINCKGGSTGISNTYVNGQLYMYNNTTGTTISNTGTFVNVSGSGIPSSQNSRYSASGTTLTCQATIRRKYLIQSTLSFDSNNNICEFGFLDSTLPGSGNAQVRLPSITKTTANSSGRAENVSLMCIIEHNTGDYISLMCRNTSTVHNITVSELNMISSEI